MQDFCRLSPGILLVAAEQVAGIYFFFYIIKAWIVAVGDDTCACLFKNFQIVDNFTSEEGSPMFQGWFINDDGGAFCLDPLHDTLDAALAEVVRITFHSQTVYTDHNLFFP